MSSVLCRRKNIPGIVNAIPGSDENRSPSRRNRCSPSARNPVRLHPGIVFTFTPESFSPCPGIRKMLASTIERYSDRPVVDMTGLTGVYDLSFDVTPEDSQILGIRAALYAGVTLPEQLLKQ